MNNNQPPKSLTDLPLGKSVSYSEKYDPAVLFKIARSQSQLTEPLNGLDIWRCYEFSFLLQNGFPVNCGLEIHVPANTKYIVESKSLKLYLGSFALEKFSDIQECLRVVKTDLEKLLESKNLTITVLELNKVNQWGTSSLPGICIDDLSVNCDLFDGPCKDLIKLEKVSAEQKLHTNIFRSLCPVTQQPDYASVIVKYKGAKIKTEGLLKYLVSYRTHSGFHESCCEKIFEDLLSVGKFEELSVACLFTRRGGIEINPVRSNHLIQLSDWNFRGIRQ